MGAVSEHPQVEEIRNHLLKYDMSVDDIVAKYSTDEHPLTKHTVNWYRRKNLKPIIEETQDNIKEEIIEEINEEWRAEKYKLIDMIRMMRHEAYKKFKKGLISINTITEIIKLVELEAKLDGELNEGITVTFAWGDKLSRSPRFKKQKGHIYTEKDLENWK